MLERRSLLSAATIDLAISPEPANVIDGSIIRARETDSFSFTISAATGGGNLTTQLTGTGGTLIPRLTLFDAADQLLIQSDSGRLVQHLSPGTYSLSVSAQTGRGAYQLTTAFAVSEQPLVPLPVGSLPRSISIGDFNSDGIADVVAPNYLDDTISVLLSHGDATFDAQRTISTGPGPISVTVADLNNDGRVDVVSANKSNNSVSVLLSNGDGTFQPHMDFPVGNRPGGIAVADFDGDGRPDLAVSNYGGATVSVLLGNGDGSFRPQRQLATGEGSGKVETSDIDGDGTPDLIVPNYGDHSVSVLLGNGDGSFASHQTFEAGTSPYSLAIADLDGDGFLDVAANNYIDNSVSILLGNGDGSLQAAQSVFTEIGSYSVTLADVNGDDLIDLLTANFSSNNVSVLLGGGDGTFAEPRTFAAGRGAGDVAVVDVDGDGRPDLVTADFTDNSVSILLGRGDGTFAVRQGAPTPAPNMRLYTVVAADLDGDGRPDIVTANKGNSTVSAILNNLDGSLQTRQTFPTGPSPNAGVVADIDGDGIADIITSSYTDPLASVLLGNGDGTFQSPLNFEVGGTTYNLTVADVTGDGRPDIITANNNSTVSVLVNEGGGSFQPQRSFAANGGITAVAASDIDGDGQTDLVTANSSADSLSLLVGNGDGTFQPARSLEVGSRPGSVSIGDLNNDGRADLVSSNAGNSTATVLLGQSDGSFLRLPDLPFGIIPVKAELFDYNGDGHLDLATANIRNGDGTLLLGNGDGTFQLERIFPIGIDAAGFATADFNSDGQADLITAQFSRDSLSIALGNGDGSFQPATTFGVGKHRLQVAVADINGDGKPDLIKSQSSDNTIHIELGTGTGSFESGDVLEVGSQPASVSIADLNNDGRADLVAANSGDDSVSVLLGNGDGSFNQQQSFEVGRSPRAVAVADLDGDGMLDLAAANYNDNSVSVLLGIGDGSFADAQTNDVGARPYSIVVADVDGDGQLDLVTANSADDTISVLLGNGDGSFQTQQTFATGKQPLALTAVDLNGDGIVDVATANHFDNSISILLGNGDGSFQPAADFATGLQPGSIAADDLDGDGLLDVVTANFGNDRASLLLGNGDGTFQPAHDRATNLFPVQTVIADVNGDGRPDLLTVGNHNDEAIALLNKGRGEFQPATAATDISLRDTPFLADINGDGFADRIILDRAGRILFRAGLPASNFAPPIVLNPARPARDMTILRRGSASLIAAADASFDPQVSTDEFVFTVSLYAIDVVGEVARQTAFITTALPARIAAQDVNGDGLADLINANPLDNSISIARQYAGGIFADPIMLAAGNAPSDIAFADVNLDDRVDVLVSNQASGDVSVLLNNPTFSFSTTFRFRAGTQPYSLDESGESPLVNSLAETVSLVAGDFARDGFADVVVVNRGAHSITVLRGNGRGGFENPQIGWTKSTSDGFDINERPGEVDLGDFNRDGELDLAVLMEDAGQLWIFSGDGFGNFEHTFTIPVGDQATGVSIVAGEQVGQLDLLVGNGFGDVLHLEGRGDGTFQIQGKRVWLSVVPDLLGPGQAGVLVGNQEDNRVTIQTQSADGKSLETVETLGADNKTQLAPGYVQWALLSRDRRLPDAVVISIGGNAVIVYHTIAIENGAPVFADEFETYFVGTSPSSLTVADINADGVPDMLIPNRGSNDVAVIFGSHSDDGTWLGNSGPRLQSGGSGPIAVAVRELTGDGIADLAVTNANGGTVTLLPGVGQGFFDDRDPETMFDLGGVIDQPPSILPGSTVAFVVRGSGDLLRFDLKQPANGSRVVFESTDLVVARALPGGAVVAVTATGQVFLLSPDGLEFVVTQELQAQSGAPTAPSHLAVLQQAGGQFQVLVSSQGSDRVSVFAAAAVQAPQFFIPPASQNLNSPSTLVFTIFFSGSTLIVNVPTESLSRIAGLSLSSFVSQNELAFTTTSTAALVAVAGNSYSTVAVLDFGTRQDDGSGDGRARMPWLSDRYPIGDASPLARFVIGLQEAVNDYRNGGQQSRESSGAESPPRDPWSVDLFHFQRTRRLPVRNSSSPQPPAAGASGGNEAPKSEPSADAPAANSNEHSALDFYWERWRDDGFWLLGGVVLMPASKPKKRRSILTRFADGC